MLSAEPWTRPGCGSLNLLATGEMCEGDTIHDRQHPHDLFMELAGRLRPAAARVAAVADLCWSRRRAGARPRRLSAPAVRDAVNPIAPISHHWIDSTHITFGLVTTGIYDRRWKAEVSVFNGREPDEDRADLDLGPLDSVSGRVTFLPTNQLALQVSAGHLREAEAEFDPSAPHRRRQGRLPRRRITASSRRRPLGDDARVRRQLRA